MGKQESYSMEDVTTTGCSGLGFLNILKQTWTLRGVIIVVLAFVVPCPLLISDTTESKCAYGVAVMAILWLTEAIPIPVTSLLPIFLFPMLGVLKAKEVSSTYINDTTTLFLGGLIIAVAVEETGLHRRIALGILGAIGTSPNMVMLGLMLPTWFLSMWISNTAATAMMVPLVLAIVSQMEAIQNDTEIDTIQYEAHADADTVDGSSTDGQDNPVFQMEMNQNNGDIEKPISNGSMSKEKGTGDSDHEKEEAHKHHTSLTRTRRGFALAVAYGANIGGISTLTGTPPNLVLQGQANAFYEEYGKKYDGQPRDSGITFANWMGFAFPLSLLVLILAWFWLQLIFIGPSCFRCRKSAASAVKSAIDMERKSLGPIRFAEATVFVVFVILAVLWIFRNPPNIDGWGVLFPGGFVSDSTASMLMSSLLFILPAEKPNLYCWSQRNAQGTLAPSKYKPILNWKVTALKLPWGVIILLGGGFALAKASLDSGLSAWLGQELMIFSGYERWIMNLIFSAVVAGATEVTSNTATATLLMPILFNLGINIGYHPLYFMITACVACSFAFMLPVATPPNAIVFSTGYLRIPHMASAGIVMNIIGVGVLTLAMNTWAPLIFDFDTFPEIFRTNATLVNATTV